MMGNKVKRKWGMLETHVRENLDRQCGMADGEELDYDKLLSDLRYGDMVAIEWQADGLEDEFGPIVDHGYVFCWPGVESRDANMGGIIHIPDPQNPGGKDRADPEWVTLYELLTNPMVKSVRTLVRMGEALSLREAVLGYIPKLEERGDLINALKDIARMTDADDPESYRSDDREGCFDAVHATACKAIAQVEGKP